MLNWTTRQLVELVSKHHRNVNMEEVVSTVSDTGFAWKVKDITFKSLRNCYLSIGSAQLLSVELPVGRKWGLLKNVLYREAPPRGPTPYPPFICHFWQKRYPFYITSIDKWYPFHLLSWQLCFSFNCCKCAVFKIWMNPAKPERFFDFYFYSHKVHR